MPKKPVNRHPVSQPLDTSYKIIPLTKQQNTLVDASDYEWLSQWNWFAYWSESAKTFYAGRHVKIKGSQNQRTIGMHQEIVGPKEADHINGNGLDNRRKNLRPCTRAQNCHNYGPMCTNTSGFKGVSFDRARNKWHAQIISEGKHHHLGRFLTPEEAARAYDEAAKRLHGEFAYQNFSH